MLEFKFVIFLLVIFNFKNANCVENKVFLNNKNYYEWVNEVLKNEAEILTVQNSSDDIAALIKNEGGVSALLWAGDSGPSKAVIEASGDKLKLVASISDGYDQYDMEYLQSKGIKLTNTPFVCNSSVSSMAIGLAIAAARNFQKASEELHNGQWGLVSHSFNWLFGQDLEDATVGIVGFGRIGQTTGKRLQSFGIKELLYYDVVRKNEDKELNAKYVTFENLLKNSDFIFIHANLTDSSKGLFDSKAFKLMKPNAVLVNTARGPIVKTDALIQALKEKTIFAAGLDVLEFEPLPLDSELYKLSNVVLTPHIGSAVPRTRRNMGLSAAENVLRSIKNEELLSPVY